MLDTSIVQAYLSKRDRDHDRVTEWLAVADDRFVTTPLAVAEMDYLAARQGGGAAVTALRDNLRGRAFDVRWWDEALEDILDVVEQRPDIGLTDASLVALAAQLRTTRIATLDERHFRALKPLTGEPAFTLLPADAV